MIGFLPYKHGAVIYISQTVSGTAVLVFLCVFPIFNEWDQFHQILLISFFVP